MEISSCNNSDSTTILSNGLTVHKLSEKLVNSIINSENSTDVAAIKINGIVSSIMGPLHPIRMFKPLTSIGSVLFNIENPFEVCRKIPGVIAAGGAVKSVIERRTPLQDNFVSNASDLDLYVRASSREEAIVTVSKILELMHPIGEVVMSENALSMTVDAARFRETAFVGCYDEKCIMPTTISSCGNLIGDRVPVYKVQVVARIIPDSGDIVADLGCLFQNYDFSCCMFATDGESYYASEAAIKSVFLTRVCKVPWERAVSPRRFAKYYHKMFDFELELPVQQTTEASGCSSSSIQESAIARTMPVQNSVFADELKEEINALLEIKKDNLAVGIDHNMCYLECETLRAQLEIEENGVHQTQCYSSLLDSAYRCYLMRSSIPKLVCANVGFSTDKNDTSPIIEMMRTGRCQECHVKKWVECLEAADMLNHNKVYSVPEIWRQGDSVSAVTIYMVKAERIFSKFAFEMISAHSISPFMASVFKYATFQDEKAFKDMWFTESLRTKMAATTNTTCSKESEIRDPFCASSLIVEDRKVMTQKGRIVTCHKIGLHNKPTASLSVTLKNMRALVHPTTPKDICIGSVYLMAYDDEWMQDKEMAALVDFINRVDSKCSELVHPSEMQRSLRTRSGDKTVAISAKLHPELTTTIVNADTGAIAKCSDVFSVLKDKCYIVEAVITLNRVTTIKTEHSAPGLTKDIAWPIWVLTQVVVASTKQ